LDVKWFLEHDIYTKMFQALDTIRDGHGWSVFDGLEKGSCTVKIVHDGAKITFESTKRKKTTAKKEPFTDDPLIGRVPLIHTPTAEEEVTPEPEPVKRSKRK